MKDLFQKNPHLSQKEFQSLKGKLISNVGPIAKTMRGKHLFEVIHQNAIDGGVEAFVRAWDKDGIPIGFGVDKTVEIERFRMYNPAILVPDKNGLIERIREEEKSFPGDLKKKRPRMVLRYREDPKEALLLTIAKAMGDKELKGSKQVIKGKVGHTISTFRSAEGATSPVDGFVRMLLTGTWHDAVIATAATWGDGNEAQADGVVEERDSNGTMLIRRTINKFDTSAIGTDKITAASLKFVTAGYTLEDDDEYAYLTVVNTSGTSSTSSIVLADYDKIGDSSIDPTEGVDTGDRIPYSDFEGHEPYVDSITFNLNSTGRGWINGAGITHLGIRGGHDCTDNAVTSGGDIENTAHLIFADYTGTANDPLLIVTHSAGAAGPTNLKSYSGNLKANIASISGNLIANIKTLAGNS